MEERKGREKSRIESTQKQDEWVGAKVLGFVRWRGWMFVGGRNRRRRGKRKRRERRGRCDKAKKRGRDAQVWR
jgi:hypothetical protein